MTRYFSDYEEFEASSTPNRRLLRQEELILEVTEALWEALNSKRITQAALAKQMGKSKAFVSQLLAGGRNLTLRTIADVADALDCRMTVRVERRPAKLSLIGSYQGTDVRWQLAEEPQLDAAAPAPDSDRIMAGCSLRGVA
jgi:transcriptional regulator with XRE-family HTH domain